MLRVDQVIIGAFHTAILCFVIIMYAVSAQFIYNHQLKIDYSIRLIATLFFIFTILCEIFVAGRLWLFNLSHDHGSLQDSNSFQNLHFLTILFGNLAQSITCLLFAHRHYFTFRDSIYESNKCISIILYFAIGIYLLFQISYDIINTYTRTFRINGVHNGIDALISTISVEILSIFILSFILISFLSKLFRVISIGVKVDTERGRISSQSKCKYVMNINNNNSLSTQITNYSDNESNITPLLQDVVHSLNSAFIDIENEVVTKDLFNYTLNEEQLKILYLGTKMSVLIFWMLFAFQFKGISNLCADIYFVRNKRYTEAIFYMTWISWGIQIIISTICVYLSFKYANTNYTRLCSWCHLKTTAITEKWIKKDVKKLSLNNDNNSQRCSISHESYH